MKCFIVLTTVAVLTVGNVIAAMPDSASAALNAGQPALTMAQQELPFDRYWSKS
jgi:hypothetical protein